MKAFKTVLKVLAVLAAIGAAVYVGITYRDTIIAWIKKVLKIDASAEEVCCCEEDCCCEEGCCEEGCCCEEATTEESPKAEDFEG